MKIRQGTCIYSSLILCLLALSLVAADLSWAAPRQEAQLTFRMMITTVSTTAQTRVNGGQVSVLAEGGEPVVYPVDANGVTAFHIPTSATSRATFSGEFVSYTLRFEFANGLMTIFNDALAADRQEAVLPYYLNVDGTYVVEYKQEYLYMLAPAEAGAFIMGPLMTQTGASTASGAVVMVTPAENPPNIPPVVGDPPSGYQNPPGGGAGTQNVGGGGTNANLTSGMFGGSGTNSAVRTRAGEVPSLEISLLYPDGTPAFREWVPIGGSGVLGAGLSWATDLEEIYGLPYVHITQSLSAEFVDSLPSGTSTLAYRLINFSGIGSNYRLHYLVKE